MLKVQKDGSFRRNLDYKFDKSTDENESLIELNRKIEQLIYEHPEEYLWGYDRFKMPK